MGSELNLEKYLTPERKKAYEKFVKNAEEIEKITEDLNTAETLIIDKIKTLMGNDGQKTSGRPREKKSNSFYHTGQTEA